MVPGTVSLRRTPLAGDTRTMPCSRPPLLLCELVLRSELLRRVAVASLRSTRRPESPAVTDGGYRTGRSAAKSKRLRDAALQKKRAIPRMRPTANVRRTLMECGGSFLLRRSRRAPLSFPAERGTIRLQMVPGTESPGRNENRSRNSRLQPIRPQMVPGTESAESALAPNPPNPSGTESPKSPKADPCP